MPPAIARLNGLSVQYLVAGSGPDVVLIHGWGSSHRMWEHFTRALSPHFRCWSLDLPGFGDSDQPGESWYSIENYVTTVHLFQEAMGLRPVRVIGHSMGGLISLDFAATYPDRVERLVVINPVVSGRPYLGPLAGWEGGAQVLDRTLRVSRRLLQPVLRRLPAETATGPLANYTRRAEDFTKASAETLVSTGRAIVSHDVRPRLGRITARTLVVLGALDANVPNSEGRLAAAEIPGSRLSVFLAGHLVTDDRPAETAALVSAFLA